MVGSDNARIDVDFYGVASVGIVEFHTTACSNIKISGDFYNSGTADLSKAVKDTVTGSTWMCEGFDGVASNPFSGGSGSALAFDDVSLVISEVAKIPKSDAAVSWNATALAAIENEVKEALAVENLDHLLKLDGTLAYPEQCVSDSILAKIIAKGAVATPSTYDNTTDSLEALRDKLTDIETDTAVIGALGAGLTDLGGMATVMKAEVNTEVDGALNTAVPITPTANSLNDILSKLDGANTFDNTTDSLEAISDKVAAVDTKTAGVQTDLDNATDGLGALKALIDVVDGFHDVPVADAAPDVTIRDVVGRKADTGVQAVTTNKSLMAYQKAVLDILAGAAGVATFPAANVAANAVSMAEVLHYVQDNVNMLATDRNATRYLAVTADMASATWNTVAAHEIATITGAVRIIILPECTGTLVGATATLVLGDETTTNSIIVSSAAPDLAAGEWWVDATMTRTIITKALINGMDIVIGGGKDIGYTIGTAALTGGSIVFHMWWSPISADGAVTAGAGGVL